MCYVYHGTSFFFYRVLNVVFDKHFQTSEEDDVDALHHSPGDLVWSRLQGYPYWPSLICRDPADDTFMRFRG